MSSNITKKCKECGSPHYNGKVWGEIKDICSNCELTLDSLNSAVKAINNYIPLTGKPRNIIITGYKIIKLK